MLRRYSDWIFFLVYSFSFLKPLASERTAKGLSESSAVLGFYPRSACIFALV
jgi:hypothetical protein